MGNKKSIKTIVLIGIIISLIFIILNMKNTNIEKQKIEKEQLGETTQSNSYVEMQTHLSEVNNKEQKLVSFKSTIANAITNQGVSTSSTDTETTMVSNISNILKARTTLNSDVAATADNISEGKEAWVNGVKIVGTGKDNNLSYEEGKKEGGAGDVILYRNGSTTNSSNPCSLTVGEDNDIRYKCSMYGHYGTYTYNFAAINMESLTMYLGAYCSGVRVLITNFLDNSTIMDKTITNGQTIDLSEVTKITDNTIPLLSLSFYSSGTGAAQDTYNTAVFVK